MVNSLATTAAEYSAPQTSATSALPTGTLEIQVGTNTAIPITVGTSGSTDNLSDLATYINQQNMGVTASVITDSSGAILSLVSQTSGTAGALTITDNTGTTGTSGMGFTQATQDVNGTQFARDRRLTDGGRCPRHQRQQHGDGRNSWRYADVVGGVVHSRDPGRPAGPDHRCPRPSTIL